MHNSKHGSLVTTSSRSYGARLPSSTPTSTSGRTHGPISHTLAQILEIVPGIDPEHALGLVQEHLPALCDFNDNTDPATLM